MIDAKALEAAAAAMESAKCPGREGPFGGYYYGYHEAFYGPAPERGRYVVRDFRDPSSPNYGAWVHQTPDHDEHEAAFERMTREHIAQACITAYLAAERERGFVMVPVEATEEMVDAGHEHLGPRRVYRAMIAASQSHGA